MWIALNTQQTREHHVSTTIQVQSCAQSTIEIFAFLQFTNLKLVKKKKGIRNSINWSCQIFSYEKQDKQDVISTMFHMRTSGDFKKINLSEIGHCKLNIFTLLFFFFSAKHFSISSNFLSCKIWQGSNLFNLLWELLYIICIVFYSEYLWILGAMSCLAFLKQRYSIVCL